MKALFFIFLLLISPLVNAAPVEFTLTHDGMRTDGAPIALADIDIRIECGKLVDGSFQDWVFTVTNVEAVNGMVQEVTSPENVDYWCRAIAIDTVNGGQSTPSNVIFLDYADLPTAPTLIINFKVVQKE